MTTTQDERQHPPPAPASTGRNGSTTSSPMAPPPPPPPPPPQFELDEEVGLLTKQQQKKMDFREILTLFHDYQTMDPLKRERAWESLWQNTLTETQEEFKQQQQLERKVGKNHPEEATPVRSGSIQPRHGAGGSSGGPEPPKRPRQTSSADVEPNKMSRLNRIQQNRPKGGSKLMQKLGGGR